MNVENKLVKRYGAVRILMYILGVPLIKFGSKQNYFVITHFTSVSIIIALLISTSIIHIREIKNTKNDLLSLKISISTVVYQLCIASNWFLYHFRRNRVQNLMKNIDNLQKYNQGKKYRFAMNTIAILILLSCVVIIGITLKSLCTDSDSRNQFFERITLGFNPLVDPVFQTVAVSIYIVLIRIFFQVIPLLVSVFYASWSYSLSVMVKNTIVNLKSSVCDTNLRNGVTSFVCSYQKIHQLVVLTEQAMSTQVFFVIASQFTLTFSYLAICLGMYIERNPVFYFEHNAFNSLQSLLFFTIAVLASKVKEEDEGVRIKVKEMALQLSFSKDTLDYGNTLFRFIDSKAPLVLTAWGIFKFTKSFLFQSVGALITYNLLLLQLDSKTE